MGTVGSEKQGPAWIKGPCGGSDVEARDACTGKVMGINDDPRVGSALPDFVGEALHEVELALEKVTLTIGTLTDGIVARFDQDAIGIRVEFKKHFPRVLEHELLGSGTGRTQVPTPGINAKLIGWPAVEFPGLELGMFARVLIDPVVTEGREPEQHFNPKFMSVLDEATEKILPNIFVLRIESPSDRKFAGTKSATDPQDEQV